MQEHATKPVVLWGIPLSDIDWATYFTEYKKRWDEKTQLRANEDLRPHSIIIPGHGIDVEQLVKRTKDGKINTATTIGKLVVAADGNGWLVKAGRSLYYTGDKRQANGKLVVGAEKTYEFLQGAKPNHRWSYSVIGATFDGVGVATEELLRRINEFSD